MKRKISFLMALLICASVFQSCGGETGGTDKETKGETTTQVSETTDYLDTLGEKDFKGATYKIVAEQSDSYIPILNMECGEITGEVINDAQYNRDRYVENRYNVVIEYPETASGDQSAVYVSSLMAGDPIGDIYVDALQEKNGRMTTVFNNGLLTNLLDVPYLQLDKEWWSRLMYDNLAINGKMFYTSGDLAPFTYIGPGCVYMNLTVAGNYGIDENDLYKKIYDGKWTMDVLYSLTKDADNDLNNDGKLDALNDFFGVVNESNALTSTMLLATTGVKLSEYNNKTGRLEVNLGTQEVIDKIDALAKMFQNIDNAGDNTNFFDKNFKLDQSIFAIHYVESALRRFRDMKSDYVIYPMPKYSEDQESYVSFINPWVKAFIAIPIVQDDIEKTGFITEVLEYKSVQDVRPAIYDVTLKGKAINNEDSIAMLDLIFSTTYIDYNAVHRFGGVLDAVNQSIFQGAPYASAYEACKNKTEADLDEFMQRFE